MSSINLKAEHRFSQFSCSAFLLHKHNHPIAQRATPVVSTGSYVVSQRIGTLANPNWINPKDAFDCASLSRSAAREHVIDAKTSHNRFELISVLSFETILALLPLSY
jgi:hypothetical protein